MSLLLMAASLQSAATPAPAGQETANAILACKVRRVDANYVNPRNPDELRLIEPRLDVVIGFTAVGSTVDPAQVRVFDPSRVFLGNGIAELSWNQQTRGFLIKTEDRGEGAVALVIEGPEAGMTTLSAIIVRTDEAASHNPLAYMFNGRCGLLRATNPTAAFDQYVASLGSTQ